MVRTPVVCDSAFRIAAQHARELRDARAAVEHGDVGGGDATARPFADEDVVMRARGDLREVRDGEHLMVRGDAPHGLADLQADAAADARVHLVEDERRHAVETREDRLERQHHA